MLTTHPVNSFGRRQVARWLKAGHRQALIQKLPTLMFNPSLSLTENFGRQGSVWLEIGFGNGEFLYRLAQAAPDVNLIGCETYINGIAQLLRRFESPYPSIRIFPDCIFLLLPHLPAASVERVFLFHPDPWPKRRHWRRRLIRPALIAELARVCSAEARWQIVTDDANYADWIAARFESSPDWLTDDDSHPFADRSTPYSRKAAMAGRPRIVFNWKRRAD